MYKDDVHEDRVSQHESASPEKLTPISHNEKNQDDLSGEGERSQSLSGASQTFVPPNGGLEAWLLVLAGFLVFSNTW